MCRALVGQGRFSIAWIGWHDSDSVRIVPRAIAGARSGFIKNIVIYADEWPEGMGPTGRTFRSGRYFICDDVRNDLNILPWHGELIERGINATAAFPIRINGKVQGVLNVYSDVPSFFQEMEINLLEEIAEDISHALDNIEARERHRIAESDAQAERAFS